MTKGFPVQVVLQVSVHCYCGCELGVHGVANSEFSANCDICGSSYNCRSDARGMVDVISTNISDKAKQIKIRRKVCEDLGILPLNLKVLNGKAPIDLLVFGKSISAAYDTVEQEVSQYASKH